MFTSIFRYAGSEAVPGMSLMAPATGTTADLGHVDLVVSVSGEEILDTARAYVTDSTQLALFRVDFGDLNTPPELTPVPGPTSMPSSRVPSTVPERGRRAPVAPPQFHQLTEPFSRRSVKPRPNR